MARDSQPISKDLDVNSASHVMFFNLSDETNSLAINAAGSINAIVTATDLDIRNLSETTDQVLIFANTVKDGTGTDLVPLLDADGHLQVDILSGATGGTEYNEDDATPVIIVGNANLIERDDVLSAVTPVEGDWLGQRGNARGAMWVELDLTNDVTIADGGNVISIDDAGGSLTVDNAALAVVGGGVEATALRVTIANDSTGVVTIDDGGGSITVDGTVAISGTVTVTATDLDIRDLTHVSDSVKVGDGTNFIAVNADGSVNVVTQTSSGAAINSYSQAAALASAGISNHDFTAAGGTFEPTGVSVSGESLGSYEILVNAVTVGFLRTSVEHPNDHFTFADGTVIAALQVVRVIRTNDSNKAHSFESTIKGNQN